MHRQILLLTTDDALQRVFASAAKSVGGIEVKSVQALPAVLTSELSKSVAVVVAYDRAEADGLLVGQLLKIAKSNRVPLVVVSDRRERMTRWMREGAYDCLARDVDMGRVPLLLDWLTAGGARSRKPDWLDLDGVPSLCVCSQATSGLVELVRKVANRAANVLLTGETGTGKTHIARIIHHISDRRSEPLISINCAAIPESLVESQLFGHARGAFTGADTKHEGDFSRVRNGTLILDEIDALSLTTQAKLLYAVDEGWFSPVGATTQKKFAGRLLVATNQNLEECARRGAFRADLYYRLGSLCLQIPPLRERREEISLLVDRYLIEASERDGCARKTISHPALKFLEQYDWPGNVRQLHNVIEQASAFAESSEIQLADLMTSLPGCNRILEDKGTDISVLPAQSSCEERGQSLRDGRLEGEKHALLEALEANGQNRTATAKHLGITRAALYQRLKKLGISTRPVPT